MSLVRMTHHRLPAREVPMKVVGKMRQNGWQVADEAEPRKRKRRSAAPQTQAPEADPGASSLPETEEGE